MTSTPYADIQALEEAFDAIEHDARAVVDGLTEEQGVWRPAPEAWSIAHCLDHLATANRVYLHAMEPPAARALREGRHRRGPAEPGWIGGWFVRSLEPPVRPRVKMKAPKKIVPAASPTLRDAVATFFTSQNDVRAFLRKYAETDLGGVRFPNPFVPGLRWSLATGLHVLAAHDRRHVWQAWNVRKMIDRS